MIKSLGRRLHLQFARPVADEAADADALANEPDGVEVEFVAYGEDSLLSGRLILAGERLTDMLNAHDEYLLTDVQCERLDDGTVLEVHEVLVPREELLLVQAAGPRGNLGRRTRTRPTPVLVQSGPYQIRGNLHSLPGADPLANLRRRKPMVPVTDAWIDFELGGRHLSRQLEVLIVNRELIDFVALAAASKIELPTMPTRKGGRLLKDMTGHVMG